MSNMGKTKNASTKKMMQSKAFKHGLEERRKGIPMDYDAYTDKGINTRWAYERGRMFAHAFPTGALINNRRLTHAAITAMQGAIWDGIVR